MLHLETAELFSAWTGQRPVPTLGAGLSPGFREKHAEPKAQDVMVSSLQDSVVGYLYPSAHALGWNIPLPAELKCGKWDIARKVESDRPSRARRSGRNKNDLAARLEWAAEKLGEANSLRLREKVPTLSQRTRKNGTRAKADSE